MKKQAMKSRLLIVLLLVLVLFCSEAYAWGGGRGGWGGRGYHYYNGGRWYQHGWFWCDTAVAALTMGALVDNLPTRYTTIVYRGVPYYYADGYYYNVYPNGGYVVVQPPVMAQPVMAQPVMAQPVMAQPVVAMPQQAVAQAPSAPTVQMSQPQAAQPSDMVTINIPSSKGGYTPVTLKKAGQGYLGPQGEYYSENPTVEELKALYSGK